MLKLLDKDFVIPIINILKNLQEKIHRVSKEMGNFRDLKVVEKK